MKNGSKKMVLEIIVGALILTMIAVTSLLAYAFLPMPIAFLAQVGIVVNAASLWHKLGLNRDFLYTHI